MVVDAVRREVAATRTDLGRETLIERVDGIDAARGVVAALALSAPFWGLLGLLVAVAR